MEKELFIGVDVSKRWLDLAYYDGVSVDWKQGHIRVDNKESGFLLIRRWLKKIGGRQGQRSVLYGVHRIVLSGPAYVAGEGRVCLWHGESEEDAPLRAGPRRERACIGPHQDGRDGFVPHSDVLREALP